MIARLALMVVASAALIAANLMPRAMGQAPVAGWEVPDSDRLPDTEWGRTVRHGRDLIAHTAALIGPAAVDRAQRFSGNALDCQSCHITAGTRQYALPLVGTSAAYPSYGARAGVIGTIQDRINGCMLRSMNGRELPRDGPQMAAMVAYIQFLSQGFNPGADAPWRGPGPLVELARPADPVRGRAVYAANCVACHGANGQGARAGREQAEAVPPLWGPHSFNDGAGMARLIAAARFIRNNMPNGTTWQSPVLAVADAWDVAAYVESRPRPHRAGLARDYPDRLEKPVDAPYGPYDDGFDATQHRLGPFAPIRAAHVRLIKP